MSAQTLELLAHHRVDRRRYFSHFVAHWAADIILPEYAGAALDFP